MLQCLVMSHSIHPVRVQNDAASHCLHVRSCLSPYSHRHAIACCFVTYPGHCFMTEDGGEIDNRFEANLGATTVAARRLVKPGETDAEK